MEAPLRTPIIVALAALSIIRLAGCREPSSPDEAASSICLAEEIPELDPAVCDFVMEPYIRYDDPDAFVFDDLPVAMYFFPQAPPAGTGVVGPVSATGVSPLERGSCRAAGIEGLSKLQETAARRGADAVVNIRATWDGERLGDRLRFGCRVERGRFHVQWEGALARLPEGEEAEARTDGDAGADPVPEETAARLRRLQGLYYQGLITREEYLEKRAAVLDEL